MNLNPAEISELIKSRIEGLAASADIKNQGTVPENRERLGQAMDLRFLLYSSLNPLAEFEKLGGHLREADTLARTLADQRRLGWVSVYMAYFLWVTGRSAEAHAAAQSAQAIAETLRDVPLEVGGNFYVGAVGLTCGDYRQTEASFPNVVQLLEGDRARDRCGLTGFPAAMARGYLTWALAERGAFEEGIGPGQAGVRLAEVLDHPFSWVVATWGPAHLYPIPDRPPPNVPYFRYRLALLDQIPGLHQMQDDPRLLFILGVESLRTG